MFAPGVDKNDRCCGLPIWLISLSALLPIIFHAMLFGWQIFIIMARTFKTNIVYPT
jgi:hypothetical protein